MKPFIDELLGHSGERASTVVPLQQAGDDKDDAAAKHLFKDHHVYALFQEAPAEQCRLCGRQQDQATPTPPPQSQHGPGMVHQRGTRQRVRPRPRHWQSGTVVSW